MQAILTVGNLMWSFCLYAWQCMLALYTCILEEDSLGWWWLEPHLFHEIDALDFIFMDDVQCMNTDLTVLLQLFLTMNHIPNLLFVFATKTKKLVAAVG